jgi:hypothetical protein
MGSLEAMMRLTLTLLAMSTIASGLGCESDSTASRQGPVPSRVTIVEPNPFLADISTPAHLNAHVYDKSGILIDASVRVAWSSTDTSVVSVDQSGTLTLHRLGTTYVLASVDTNGARAQDSVEVDVIKEILVNKARPTPNP